MPPGKMHADEVAIDAPLVERLLVSQFPAWAGLPLSPVRSAGTDHALYRLGEDLAVRLPRIAWAVGQVEKEHLWLPRLAPHVPLTIPEVLGVGRPDEGYPFPWGVYRWVEGVNATMDRVDDPHRAASDLAAFVKALHRVDPAGGPPSGPHNFGRGVPLALRDEATRTALTALDGMIDTVAAIAAWENALRAMPWEGDPVWVHGDLQSGNLLAVDGRLRAVIDFGGLGVGDPACDLIVAWNLFSREVRETFRRGLGLDDAAWARGRGWALSVALIALPYYNRISPGLAAVSRLTIREVLADPA